MSDKKVQAASAQFSQINVNLTVWAGYKFPELCHQVAFDKDSVTFHLTD